MNTKRAILFFMTAVGVMLTGCDVNDPIYDTAHPGHGQITLTLNWSNMGAGIIKPTICTGYIGEHSVTLTSDYQTVGNLFLPGTYHARICNPAEKIVVSGASATVATVSTPTYGTGVFLDLQPGWWFSSVLNQTIERDKDYDITAHMQQQVRELNLVLTPTGGTPELISGITATLDGVASTLNMDTDVHGSAASVAPLFTKQADGKWKATVRLLGVAGTSQKLRVTLNFIGGNPSAVNYQIDMATHLSAFNADKKTPLSLGALVVESPLGAGFTATITDWVSITGSGTAD